MSELDRMDADVWRRRCEELEAENERLRAALHSIEIFTRDSPHDGIGDGCGEDTCVGCLIWGTALAGLRGESDGS